MLTFATSTAEVDNDAILKVTGHPQVKLEKLPDKETFQNYHNYHGLSSGGHECLCHIPL